jgi:magnesium transporter
MERDDQEHVEPGTHYRVQIGGPEGVRSGTPEEAASCMQRGAVVALNGSPPDQMVWVDIVRPTEDDATMLRDTFGFHPLAVEDCMHGEQMPKLERYRGYFFLVLYSTRINVERNRPTFNELHCFVGPNYLVTVRQGSVREVRELLARWRAAPRPYPTIGHLAHSLIDTLVDGYFPMVDHFGARVAATESEVYERPASGMQTIMGLRRELLRFRGFVGPTRDVLGSLLRRDLPFINPELMPYFQDVRDHTVRVTEEIDMLRDLLSTAVEAQATVQSNQLNQTVRMMTAWSIILMSMTLIAGIYGMNFRHMPELLWPRGYAFSLGLMLVVGLALVFFFRRRRWL